MKVLSNDFLCGSGKTYNAIEHASRLHAPLIFVQPTIDLLERTASDHRFDKKKKVIIHSQNTNDVGSAIADALHKPMNGVIFITHASWLRIENVPRDARWNLILDEIPQINFTTQLNLSEHRSELLDAFELKQYSTFYDECKPNSQTRRILKNEAKDEIWNMANLREVLTKIENRHWTVHCDSSACRDFREGKQDSMTFHGVFQPSCLEGYESVAVLGAAMEYSLLFKLWSGQLTFEPHADFRPRFEVHKNTDRISISYSLNEPFSKAMRKNRTEDGSCIIDKLKDGVEAHFSGEEYLWLGNADMGDYELRGIRLPNMPHGINDERFISKNNVAVLSALNCTPAHIKYLERTQGITPDALYESTGLSSCYQAIMRCSLRDPDSREPVKLVVPDARLAHLLKERFFPEAHITALPPIGPVGSRKAGRPRLHATDAARKRTERLEHRAQMTRELDALRESVNPLIDIGNSGLGDSSYHSSEGWVGGADQQVWPQVTPCQFYDDVRAAKPFVEEALSHSDFIELLRIKHEHTYTNKTDNVLVSAAYFAPNPSIKTTRGIENIAYLSGIWLDNDGDGDLSVDEFVSLFPRWEMYIFNTYSSGNAGKRRWRVYIPSKFLLPVSVHKFITTVIKTRLADKKFYGRRYVDKHREARFHGFDESKFCPSSLFYLPCQSAFQDTFWEEHVDEGRAMLNPYLEVDRTHIMAREDCSLQRTWKETQGNAEAARASVNSARDACVNAPAGTGHDRLFRLRCALDHYHVSKYEKVTILRDTARLMRSPSERLSEIPHLSRHL